MRRPSFVVIASGAVIGALSVFMPVGAPASTMVVAVVTPTTTFKVEGIESLAHLPIPSTTTSTTTTTRVTTTSRPVTPPVTSVVTSVVTTPPVTAATPVTAPPTTPPDLPAVWACIGRYESGNDPTTNTGNGYYGEWQDTLSTWDAAGGLAYAPRPDLANEADQLTVNEEVQREQGWGAWPVTSRICNA